ncbi:FtsX-like permease family protein [Streptomyces sp. NPDC088812]|uniref:ABC transporter permease n=1 Tax=Streptomyces sp. NPDC088812 TaxID=3365905 RepID=UPI0037F9B796
MSTLGRVVRAGVARRRVQTTVMVLTTLVAVTASILAVGLTVASRAPFDRAFARQHGAHLTARFDGTKVTSAQLTATARASGVSAAAGPFRTLTARPRTVSGFDDLPAGLDLPPVTVVGRAGAGGPVDRIDLVEGAWATRPGEIVVADGVLPVRKVGARLAFPDAADSPTLTVVGVARSVTGTAEAWVTPAQAEALAEAPAGTQADPSSPDPSGADGTSGSGGTSETGGAGGTRGSGGTSKTGGTSETGGTSGSGGSGGSSYEMLYRFHDADTDDEVAAGRDAVAALVPRGAMTGTLPYLTVRQEQTANAMAFVPFLAAFGVLGLSLSVLVIGIVVSGSVGAATRRIGVLKALGLTPAQIVLAYVGQALVPAAVGCAAALVLGNLLAGPVLAEAGEALGAPAGSLPLRVDLVVPAAALVLVAGAALWPALRAGRLRTADALTGGRARGTGRGRALRRLTARLPVPRAVSLGLAHPFARPARSGTMAAAVAFGAVSVTFAVGLALSLGAVSDGRRLNSAGSVVVQAGGSQGPPGADVVPAAGEADVPKADPERVAAVLRAQRGTSRFYGTVQAQVGVTGIAGETTVVAYEGDSSWGAPRTVSGRWLDGPGQAAVTGRFLKAAGVEVGDTVTLTQGGRQASVRIVGEVFFTEGKGMALLTSTSTLSALGVDARPGRYDVRTEPGTDADAYLTALNAALEPVGATALPNTSGSSSVVLAMDALIGMLTLMLVVVAGLGVLNTVVLDTRDRIRDLGVFKALGMTPRQTVAMVVVSVAWPGLLVGAAVVPVGVALHHWITPLMGDAAGLALPAATIAVYDPSWLVALALGGLVITVAGGLLPAGWAARTDTATALRTE